MYRRLLYIVMVMCVLALPGTLAAHTQPSYYWHWADVPSQRLLDIGRDFGHNGHIDSAMQCYSVIVNRLTDDPKVRCKAHDGMARIYLFEYFDYPKALSHLKKAQKLEKQGGFIQPLTYSLLQTFYQCINNNVHDPHIDSLVIDYGRKAFFASVEQNEIIQSGVTFLNNISSAIEMNRVGELSDLANAYTRLHHENGDSLHLIANDFYQAGLAIENKQWNKAIGHLNSMLSHIPTSNKSYNCTRIQFMGISNLASIYQIIGDTKHALDYLHQLEQLSLEHNIKEGLLIIYYQKARIYQGLGNQVRYMDYTLKRTELKDSLIGYQQAMQLSKAEFESELSDMELQLAQLNHRQQMMLVTSILCGIIALLVLGLGYFIHRRNRQLSARNQALYDKNQQLIVANKHERMTREQLEELLEQTRREQAEALAAVSQQELVDNDDTEEPDEPKGEPVKYKDSRLTELDKNRLQSLIQKVLDTPDVICDPDFTVMQLAALIGARQREVSQVIGERYGANFNIVVNDHRVKEACRRIQDEPRFLQNTIEAMAGEVGIRSRNTFTQAFKRVTGMNPSEYIRRARTR